MKIIEIGAAETKNALILIIEHRLNGEKNEAKNALLSDQVLTFTHYSRTDNLYLI